MTKKILSLLVIILTVTNLLAQQVPQAINYQAVARTATGLIIPTQNVNVRFSILDGSVNGTLIYQETHATTTNNFGLFTLSIGTGTVVSGTFNTINWGSGSKFLQVEISADGTNNYQVQGTTQLLSVPYALYAQRTNLVAGNAISISNGNIINANYLAGTGINITGNTIAHNLVGGTGINVTGNTISHNLVAGNGIDITGNTITATTNSQWLDHANGIYYNAGRVGIGTIPMGSSTPYPLWVHAPSFGGLGHASAFFSGDDPWHAAIAIRNTTSDQQYTFMVGGATNAHLLPRNFSIYNSRLLKHSFVVEGNTNFIGIGYPNVNTITAPKSTLHVFTGDVNIEQIGSGIILKSPNGQCWRVTIDNTGNLVRTAISCPN